MSDTAVHLAIPASSGYLVLARTAVAAICARLDYSIDRIDDLKLAIDEACSVILSDSVPGEAIELSIDSEADGHLHVDIAAITVNGKAPSQNSFSWTVLSALVEEVTADVDQNNRLTVHLKAARQVDVVTE